MKRPHLIRLRDMLDNIDAVAGMTDGVDLAAYRRDFMMCRAVERCVEIISEASRSIPGAMTAEFPDQPWPEIAAIGNLLRHHCDRVDDLIMWKIATRSLPNLRPAVVAMLLRVESSD